MIYTRAGEPVEIIAAERRDVRSIVTGAPTRGVPFAQVRFLNSYQNNQLAYGGEYVDAALHLRSDHGWQEIEAACAAIFNEEKKNG